MTSSVDQFLKKSQLWPAETKQLRTILRQSKLTESLKWNLPCYSHGEANIAIIQPFKASLALMFFKGALLKDAKGVLVEVGPNSRSARRLEFHSVAEITKLASTIQAYLKEAVANEKAGKKVTAAPKVLPLPTELKAVFTKKPKVEKAFRSLTPGRQRAYLFHFSSAKQSATRTARIEKCVPNILEGKGFNER